MNVPDEGPELPNFPQLEGEQAEMARDLVRAAMSLRDPLGTIRMNHGLSDQHGIVLDCRTGTCAFRLGIYGWHPTPRLSVVELIEDFWAIATTGERCEEVARTMQTRQGAKTLLTDSQERKEASGDMLRELDTLSGIAWPRVASLQDLHNWNGIIPKDALIFMSIPRPISEVPR